ncbi:MAG: hypothetical protein PHO92_05245 [Candidatus Peribacteraceae bacterium]|nr:hypothetical protein [Candidatus Peribacteraceae bacterium]
MHLSPVRTAAIITLALLGSAAILALLTIATGFLTVQSKTASDVLPARETVLLIEQPSQETIDQFGQWFPRLKGIAIPPSSEAAALVRLPNGATELLIFARAHGQQETAEELLGTFPPFVVLASSQEALTLVRETKGVLSQFKPFQQLVRVRARDGQWTYLRTDALPAAAGTTEQLMRHLLFGQDRFAAITQQTDSVQIDTTDQQPPAIKYLATPPETWSMANPILAIAVHDLAAAFRGALQQFPAEEQAVLQAILAQRIRAALGPDVSMEFDLLPLLENETMIALSRNGSGALAFAIRGETKRAEQAMDLLRILQESAGNTLRGTEVRTRLFDGRFPAKDIRLAQQEQPEPAKTENGWHVWRGRTADETAPLIGAVKGRTFVLSNDTASAEALLAASQGTVAPARRSLAVQGQAQLQALMETARMMNLSLTDKVPLFFRLDGSAQWEVSAGEHGRSVRIEWKEPE